MKLFLAGSGSQHTDPEKILEDQNFPQGMGVLVTYYDLREERLNRIREARKECHAKK